MVITGWWLLKPGRHKPFNISGTLDIFKSKWEDIVILSTMLSSGYVLYELPRWSEVQIVKVLMARSSDGQPKSSIYDQKLSLEGPPSSYPNGAPA